MSSIKISEGVLKRLKHYARKDEDWSQTITRLLNDLDSRPQKEYIPYHPYNPPENPIPWYPVFTYSSNTTNWSDRFV